MDQLRDLQSMLDISLVDPTRNVGDIETKHDGSMDILSQFFANGSFVIAPMGRKDRLQLSKVTSSPSRQAHGGFERIRRISISNVDVTS